MHKMIGLTRCCRSKVTFDVERFRIIKHVQASDTANLAARPVAGCCHQTWYQSYCPSLTKISWNRFSRNVANKQKM